MMFEGWIELIHVTVEFKHNWKDKNDHDFYEIRMTSPLFGEYTINVHI